MDSATHVVARGHGVHMKGRKLQMVVGAEGGGRNRAHKLEELGDLGRDG